MSKIDDALDFAVLHAQPSEWGMIEEARAEVTALRADLDLAGKAIWPETFRALAAEGEQLRTENKCLRADIAKDGELDRRDALVMHQLHADLAEALVALRLARQFVNGDSPEHGVFAAIDAVLTKHAPTGGPA
jgi:hypothetical protein